MTTRCPSDLALEAYLLRPDSSELAPHVDGCPACRTRVARMQAEGDDFRQFVFPATVDAVEAAAGRRRFRWRALLAPAGALAAAAAALVLVLRADVGGPGGPPDGGVQLKGDALKLAVFVGDAEGARVVEDGAPVPATAAIRFVVRPADAREGCFLWILSVDAAGAVSRLYPPAGAAQERRPGGEIPGGAVLDGKGGPERIFAVCGPTPLAWGDVEGAAARAAGGGAAAVRAAKGIPDLPRTFAQASHLLEKTP